MGSNAELYIHPSLRLFSLFNFWTKCLWLWPLASVWIITIALIWLKVKVGIRLSVWNFDSQLMIVYCFTFLAEKRIKSQLFFYQLIHFLQIIEWFVGTVSFANKLRCFLSAILVYIFVTIYLSVYVSCSVVWWQGPSINGMPALCGVAAQQVMWCTGYILHLTN